MDYLLDISILYRQIQMYFDRVLEDFDLGSGQLLFLLLINEHEGITMNQLTTLSKVDKGTTTKSINRLIEQGYVESVLDENDRRIKHLYTTSTATNLMTAIFEHRKFLRNTLSRNMDFGQFEEALHQVCENVIQENTDLRHVEILKIGKIVPASFTTFPGKLTFDIYGRGCNMKCPYCQQKDMVFIPDDQEDILIHDVLKQLEKNAKWLDMVVITGGEPTLQEAFGALFQEIKKYHLPILIWTNGTQLDVLKKWVEQKWIDEVIIDVKHRDLKYMLASGINQQGLFDQVCKTLDYLQQQNIPYRINTTVVEQLHEYEDLLEIGKVLPKHGIWQIQPFIPSENTIQQGLTPYPTQQLHQMVKQLQMDLPDRQIIISGGAYV